MFCRYLIKMTVNWRLIYRPVSPLPCLPKICEKVAFFHLFDFLNMIGFFYRLQSGFRPGDSTVMQLVYILFTKFMRPLMKGVRWGRAVLLDISKAFDRVWHRGLITKSRSIEVEGNLLNGWFISLRSKRFLASSSRKLQGREQKNKGMTLATGL